jgi:hypothetical protein
MANVLAPVLVALGLAGIVVLDSSDRADAPVPPQTRQTADARAEMFDPYRRPTIPKGLPLDKPPVQVAAVAPLRDFAFVADDMHTARGLPHAHGPQLFMLMITGMCLMAFGRLLRSEWSAVDDGTVYTGTHPTDGARI